MGNLITDPAQVTPEWLTQVLRERGYLPRGGVTDVRLTVESSFTSTVARLTLAHSGDSPPTAPSRLFLKISDARSEQGVVGSQQRRREVEFYSKVATAMSRPPIVRCYDAVYSDETGASHLLFDDVSDTHFQTQWPLPPAKPHCESAMDSFSEFHAFWWDHPALGEVDELPSAESVADYVGSIRECFPRFADFLGDRLSDSRRDLYDRVLASLPGLWNRATQGKALTLIHGDANFWNVLLPRDPSKGQALIIDWQLWNIRLATDDLSNLIALHWYADRRQTMERDLLRRYHRGLLRHGVEGYEWADCWHDYRRSVVTRVLFMPMWQWSGGVSVVAWWPNLERAMQAYQDLDCGELLT